MKSPEFDYVLDTAVHGYLPHNARRILGHKRSWVLLKLRFVEQYSGCKFALAQWDPSYKDGSFILLNESQTVIEIKYGANNIEHFVPLGD